MRVNMNIAECQKVCKRLWDGHVVSVVEVLVIFQYETETGPKYSNVVSAENEAEAEFNILFTAETETKNQ